MSSHVINHIDQIRSETLELGKQLQEKDAEIQAKYCQVQELNKTLREKDATIAAKEATILNNTARIVELSSGYTALSDELQRKDTILVAREADIQRVSAQLEALKAVTSREDEHCNRLVAENANLRQGRDEHATTREASVAANEALILGQNATIGQLRNLLASRDYAIERMLRSGRYTGVRADLARTCFIEGWQSRKEWFFEGAVPAPSVPAPSVPVPTVQEVTLYQAVSRDEDGYPEPLTAYFLTEEHAQLFAAHGMRTALDALSDTDRAETFATYAQLDKSLPAAGACEGLPRMPRPTACKAIKAAQGYHLVPPTVLAVYRSPDPDDVARAQALAKLTPRERVLLGHPAEETP